MFLCRSGLKKELKTTDFCHVVVKAKFHHTRYISVNKKYPILLFAIFFSTPWNLLPLSVIRTDKAVNCLEKKRFNFLGNDVRRRI